MEDFRKILEEEILKDNGNNKIIFLSEADFQFSLAWQIKEKLKGKVILEYPDDIVEKDKNGNDRKRRIYYDIWVEDESGKTHLIELKYRTKGQKDVMRYDRKFDLKNQSAQDLGRYHFIKDIERLEAKTGDKKIATGNSYCIMLTNDGEYYKEIGETDTRDRNFRIHQGAKIKQINPDDKIDWYFKDGEPEPNKRPSYMGDPLEIRHEYTCKWEPYCTVSGGGTNSEFKYLMLEVPSSEK